MGLFTSRQTVFVDSDVLVIGGGFGGCAPLVAIAVEGEGEAPEE